MLSIFYGTLAALGWGAAGFSGGLAARKANAYQAVMYAEFTGLPVILLFLAFSGETFPGWRLWTLAMSAGALGTVGLILLYRATSEGMISVAAPISALLAASLPVVVGALLEGLPNGFTLLGFGFALFAVWMISQGTEGIPDLLKHLSDLKLPLLAGIGFGSYFILMHRATGGAAFYPMLASRTGGTILVAAYMLLSRSSWKMRDASALPLIFLNGTLDICGNFFFILSGQVGRLDVASVLSSLYSGVTVVLAWIFLKEKLSAAQRIGIASAFIAIALITM